MERREDAVKRWKVREGLAAPDTVATTPAAARLTTGDWLWRWHARLGESVQDDSKRDYAAAIQHHLAPHIGQIPLWALGKDAIYELIWVTLPAKRKVVGGQTTDEPALGGTRRRAIYFVLKAALDSAFKDGLVARNYADLVDAPRRTKRKDEGLERFTWVAEYLLGRIENEPDVARWWLAFLGIRRSEALGLTDDCFHLDKSERAYIDIKQQLARESAQHGCGTPDAGGARKCKQSRADLCPQKIPGRGLYIKTQTKTQSSTRQVPVSGLALEIFRAHLKQQRKFRKTPEFQPSQGLEKLVFTTKTGKPIKHQKDAERWHELLAEHKIEDMRGHAARHIATTLLSRIEQNPQIVAKIIGHADISMTGYYTHLSREASREAVTGHIGGLSSRTSAAKEEKTKAKREAKKAALLKELAELEAKDAAEAKD